MYNTSHENVKIIYNKEELSEWNIIDNLVVFDIFDRKFSADDDITDHGMNLAIVRKLGDERF